MFANVAHKELDVDVLLTHSKDFKGDDLTDGPLLVVSEDGNVVRAFNVS